MNSLQTLQGVGAKTEALFHKLNIDSTDDLLHFYPRDYDQLEEISTISSLQDGKQAIIKAGIVSNASEKKAGKLTITSFQAADETGRIQFTYFNVPFVKNELKKGAVFLFRGRPSIKDRYITMDQPVKMTMAEYQAQKSSLQPVYTVTKGLTQRFFRKCLKQLLDNASLCDLQEFLPESLRQKYQLLPLKEAMAHIHFPDHMDQLIAARRRLAFDEFFLFLFLVRQMKDESDQIPNSFPMIETADTNRLLEGLPYALTEDQLKTWREIVQDLTGSYTMNRLVQGDVGSGKTILATLALLCTAVNGYQGALMAPTEVLAVQHFSSISEMAKQYHLPLKPVLLTGSLSAKEKRLVYEQIRLGDVNVIIGTHALFQEAVEYEKLALVITDEQHRFGVRQRETLAGKGLQPHVMVMSATPIPRTLAMILYGDLHISTIRHLPAERLPIKNCVVGTGYRSKAYQFLEKEVAQGHQAFVICPMIEEDEECDLENVDAYTDKLRKNLSQRVIVEKLHGKMKPAQKNLIMEEFASGKIDILVSTTVIEVGVNVPNATVMMIENAERFGLAQLHQLRGRVGRGGFQSYCIFINTVDSDKSRQRLEVLNHSNDGFYIAEQDLKLRGPGDFFGIRQSGEMQFRVADIYQDGDLLQLANEAAEQILSHENWRELSEYENLRKVLEKNGSNQVDFPSI